MFIHPINKQNDLSHRGLYFVKSNNMVFNPNLNFLTKKGMKTSENGFLYYEANDISQEIKDKFKSSKFIQNLAKKYDTFVWYSEVYEKQREIENNANISLAKITWANLNQPVAQERVVIGGSNISQNKATEEMFEKLQREDFQTK